MRPDSYVDTKGTEVHTMDADEEEIDVEGKEAEGENSTHLE